MRIRPLAPGEAPLCEDILRSLPDWFGIEESIVQYRKDLDVMETWVADIDGRPVGFLTMNVHNPQSAEIHVMGVLRDHQRRGAGKALIRHAESLCRDRNIEYLQVKTLGPSHESPSYKETRRFYGAVGFQPLEETRLWGEGNPCLILVKHLSCIEGPVS